MRWILKCCVAKSTHPTSHFFSYHVMKILLLCSVIIGSDRMVIRDTPRKTKLKNKPRKYYDFCTHTNSCCFVTKQFTQERFKIILLKGVILFPSLSNIFQEWILIFNSHSGIQIRIRYKIKTLLSFSKAWISTKDSNNNLMIYQKKATQL